MTKKQREKEEAKQRLLEWLKPGDTVYTIVERVSRSGMSRNIRVVVFLDNKASEGIHPNHAVATLLGWTLKRVNGYDTVHVSGCGMDMGFHLVYALSQELFNDGYALKQRWL